MKYLLIAIFGLAAGNVYAKDTKCNDFSQYKDVSVKEMKTIAKKGDAVIVDVNSKSSYEKAKIGNAIHYDERTFASKLPKDKDQLIVAYCGGKRCTAWQRAAESACEMGYKNIKHFSNGIKGWKKAQKKQVNKTKAA